MLSTSIPVPRVASTSVNMDGQSSPSPMAWMDWLWETVTPGVGHTRVRGHRAGHESGKASKRRVKWKPSTKGASGKCKLETSHTNRYLFATPSTVASDQQSTSASPNDLSVSVRDIGTAIAENIDPSDSEVDKENCHSNVPEPAAMKQARQEIMKHSATPLVPAERVQRGLRRLLSSSANPNGVPTVQFSTLLPISCTKKQQTSPLSVLSEKYALDAASTPSIPPSPEPSPFGRDEPETSAQSLPEPTSVNDACTACAGLQAQLRNAATASLTLQERVAEVEAQLCQKTSEVATLTKRVREKQARITTLEALFSERHNQHPQTPAAVYRNKDQHIEDFQHDCPYALFQTPAQSGHSPQPTGEDAVENSPMAETCSSISVELCEREVAVLNRSMSAEMALHTRLERLSELKREILELLSSERERVETSLRSVQQRTAEEKSHILASKLAAGEPFGQQHQPSPELQDGCGFPSGSQIGTATSDGDGDGDGETSFLETVNALQESLAAITTDAPASPPSHFGVFHGETASFSPELRLKFVRRLISDAKDGRQPSSPS